MDYYLQTHSFMIIFIYLLLYKSIAISLQLYMHKQKCINSLCPFSVSLTHHLWLLLFAFGFVVAFFHAFCLHLHFIYCSLVEKQLKLKMKRKREAKKKRLLFVMMYNKKIIMISLMMMMMMMVFAFAECGAQ